jgi:1-acyl-sn-glycerol-3-phosphate acyltransferase
VARRKRGFAQRLVAVVVKPPLFVLTRRHWRGAEHLPTTGGVILVANHLSYIDPLVLAHFVYDAGRWPQFLGKQGVFDVPMLGWALRRLRQIPVQRGTVDAAKALSAARTAIEAGDVVVIYPEGTITKHPQLWPMRGRTGVARLWEETGAPVIPVVMWGPQDIHHPGTGKLRLRPRTPVTVIAGAPIDLSAYRRETPLPNATLHEVTQTVMLRLRDLLAEIRGGPAPALWSPGGAPETPTGGRR